MRITLTTILVIQLLLIIAKLAGWSLSWWVIFIPTLSVLFALILIIILLVLSSILFSDKDNILRNDYD